MVDESEILASSERVRQFHFGPSPMASIVSMNQTIFQSPLERCRPPVLRCSSSLQFQRPAFIISCAMSEIIFEVREDEVEGGFTASALGLGIHSEGETLEELRANVREAVDCYFDETMEAPRIIRLHFVRDEVLAR